MSVPRSTEAKCLLLISSIAKLWSHSLIVIKPFIVLEESFLLFFCGFFRQLTLISFSDARI
ncbi:BnaC05g50990D [Brassica napus]|uniref:Uncharacterized protein n=2 Tax=Brassica TaxID=3705 RepID=A0A0D3CDG2_BRAOL|nr:unnamed protein product [Brassica napus]CDY50736.1 BnaC05g50990D [Brassica napus]